jgi:hypothetical protein
LITEAGFTPQQRDILYRHVARGSAIINPDHIYEASAV